MSTLDTHPSGIPAVDAVAKALAEFGHGRRVPFGDPVFNSVMDHLMHEAKLLDRERLDEWMGLLADDLRYEMPVRATVRRGEGDGFRPGMAHFADTLPSIALRVRRLLESPNAWAEDPPSRTRRFITDVTVHEADVDDEVDVSSYILLLRNRYDASSFELISAERQDRLRRRGDGWKLARRIILVDQSTLGTPNLAIFL